MLGLDCPSGRARVSAPIRQHALRWLQTWQADHSIPLRFPGRMRSIIKLSSLFPQVAQRDDLKRKGRLHC